MVKTRNWYIVYTKPDCEKRIGLLLERRGIECYFPSYNTDQIHQGRLKKIAVPLFSRQLFILTCEDELELIKKVGGVISFMHCLQKPAIIDEADINAIKNILIDCKNIKVEKINMFFAADQNTKGSASGKTEFEMVRTNGLKKVFLSSLGFALVTENISEDINADQKKTEKIEAKQIKSVA